MTRHIGHGSWHLLLSHRYAKPQSTNSEIWMRNLNYNPQMQQKHGVLFDKQFTCMIYDWVLQTASYGVRKHANALTG